MAMRTFDFTPLFRSTVGFDRLPSLFDAASRLDETPSYPPYNIEKTGADAYRIVMAVAGFSPEEVSVVAQANSLTITGKSLRDESQAKYLHRGIAARSFERRFDLADHITVTSASLNNGLLSVDLVREVPEAMKPRSIRIEGASKPATIDSKAA
jgi:molecular chaperone IbpA